MLSNLSPDFDLAIEVASGVTTAWGTFQEAITVLSGATLTPSGWNGWYFTANNDLTIQVGATLSGHTAWVFKGPTLTVNGMLVGGSANSSVYLYRGALRNDGTISVPYVFFNGSHTVEGTGRFVGSTAKIEGGATVTLGSSHQMSNVINIGSLTTPAVVLDITGNFANSGIFTHGNGTLRFSGSTLQNLTLNTPTTFFNLAIANGATLVETAQADNAAVLGVLTNDGVIRKTKSVSGPGAITYGLTEVGMNIVQPGTLSAVQVDRIDRNPPAGPAGVQTGRYWQVIAGGGAAGYNVTLILPHRALNNPSACRHEGGGIWNCARSSYSSSTVSRSGITQLSEWAVGNGMQSPTHTPTPTRTTRPTNTPTPTQTPRFTPTPTPSANLITRSFQNGVAPKASYSGSVDTYLSEQQATANFGSAASLIASGNDPAGSNKDKWALMKWDLSSTTGIINSASLALNITDHSGGQTYDLVAAQAAWAETTTAWNTKPAAGTTVLSALAPASTGLLTINLNASGIAAVQQWINTPAKNYGLYLLKTTATNTLAFDAREKTTATLRPKLTVTFKPPALTRSPWVQSVTATTATVLWETDTFAKSNFKFRKRGATTWTSKTVKTTLISGRWQGKAALTGLTRATVYEYQVRASADSPWTSILTFTTAAAAPPSDPPAHSGELPGVAAMPPALMLSAPDTLQATSGGLVKAPVFVTFSDEGSDSAPSGLVFALSFDPALLYFDPADADDDGLPDGLDFHLPGDFSAEAVWDAEGGKLAIRLSDFSPEQLAELDGALIVVGLIVSDVSAPTSAAIRFVSDPAAVAFDGLGNSYPIETVDGAVQLPRPSTIFMPQVLH